MFRSTATPTLDSSPVSSDWTIRRLLGWIADDDTRSHDASLLPLLAAVDASLRPGAPTGLPTRSPVALVRAIAAGVRSHPELGDGTVGSAAHATATEDCAAAGTQADAAPAATSAPASALSPRLRLT